MSRLMQLKVTVTSHYQNDLADAYPNLARHLGYLDQGLVRSNPSLYELAGRLDNLLYTFDSTPLREVLLRQRPQLLELHKSIEKQIADWNLAQADKLLYRLEDIFDRIEEELA